MQGHKPTRAEALLLFNICIAGAVAVLIVMLAVNWI
jgi:hypothetical protein